VLAFDLEQRRFVALQRLPLGVGDSGQPPEPAWRVAVDSAGRTVAAATLRGSVTVFCSTSDVQRPLQLAAVTPFERLSSPDLSLDACLWSLAFSQAAPECPDPDASTLLLLSSVPAFCADQVDGTQVCSTLELPGGELNWMLFLQTRCRGLPFYDEALHLLAVPGAPGMLLALCVDAVHLCTLEWDGGVCNLELRPSDEGPGRSLSLASLHSQSLHSTAASIPCAWAWRPQPACGGAAELALALDCGQLLMLQVDTSCGCVTARCVAPQGRSWHCLSALAWMPGGALLACAHGGDALLLQVSEVPFSAGEEGVDAGGGATLSCSAHDVLPGTSPALSLACGPQDTARLVCGSAVEGSLRTVHAGAATAQLLVSPDHFAGVTHLWALHTSAATEHHQHQHQLLVLSFASATRVLALAGACWEDVSDDCRLDTRQQTLTAGTLGPGIAVQVCPSHVAALQWGAGDHVALMAAPPGERFSVACVAHGRVACGLARSHDVLLLHLAASADAGGGGQAAWAPGTRVRLPCEPSALHIAPPGAAEHLCAGDAAHGARSAPVVVVGMYAQGVVLLSASLEAPGLVLSATQPDGWGGAAGVGAGAVPHALHVVRRAGSSDAEDTSLLVATRTGHLLRLQRVGAALRCVQARQLGRVPASMVALDHAGGADGELLLLSERPWLLSLLPGAQRLALQPTAPPACFTAGCGCAVRVGGGGGGGPVVALLDGPKLRLLALHARPPPAAPLCAAARCLAMHPPSGCALVAYALAQQRGQSPGPARQELCAVLPRTGLPVSSPASLRAGEVVHCLRSWWFDAGTALVLVGTGVGVGAPPGASPDACDLGRLLVLALDLRAPGEAEAEAERRGAPPLPQLRGTGEWGVVAEAHLSGPVLAVCGGAGGCLLASAGELLHTLRLKLRPGACRGVLTRLGPPTRLRGPVTDVACMPDGGQGAPAQGEAEADGADDGASLVVVSDARDGLHVGCLLLDPAAADSPLKLSYSEPAPRCASALTAVKSPCGGGLLVGGVDRAGAFFAASLAADPATGGRQLATVASFRTDGLPVALASPDPQRGTFLVCTLLGALSRLRPLSDDAFARLARAEELAAAHPATCPPLGNLHGTYRGGSPGQRSALDGDLLALLLHLPVATQREVLGVAEGDLEAETRMLACLADIERALLPLACGWPQISHAH